MRSINATGEFVSQKASHKLIMAIFGAENSLRYVFVLDSELVIPRTKVYLREGPQISTLVKEVVYPRQRVTVLDRYLV